MGQQPSKAADNIYCRCRKEASAFNEKLKSREGAAELLGVSPSSLADYELGNTKVVPVDKVELMAELYNAPELRNYYCKNVCPLGQDIPQIETGNFDRITVRALLALNELDDIKGNLLKIGADGQVNDDERADFERILKQLDDIAAVSQSLKIWAEKNLK